MNQNLPMKKENGLFEKIKIFFRNLFYKPVHDENMNVLVDDKIDVTKVNKTQQEQFGNSIRVKIDNNVQKQLERNNLFDKIRENPEILNSLSSNQLENLSAYYDKVIEKNNEIIAKKQNLLNNAS